MAWFVWILLWAGVFLFLLPKTYSVFSKIFKFLYKNYIRPPHINLVIDFCVYCKQLCWKQLSYLLID